MRLITARQAWHDCYFNGGDSPLARATEIAKLGAHIQTTAYHDSNNRAMHVATAGKVQNAIATLPQELQRLGHWLYAPLTREEADHIADSVHDFIFKKSGLAASNKKTGQARYWMTRAVMLNYQDAALGRHVRLKKPCHIKEYLADWYGITLSNNWSQIYRPVWEKLWAVIDDLDQAALSPVSEIVYKHSLLEVA